MKLSLLDICVFYGRHQAVKNISLMAKPGEILAIAGPNGSGKSSLLKAVAGITAYQGICLFGDVQDRPKRIGYMPQDNAARTSLTVMETILLGRIGRLGLHVTDDHLAAVTDLLSHLALTPLAQRPLSELSGGQRQLVFLAQAMAGESPLLLLDEPLSALDLCHQLTVMDIVAQLTRTRGLTTIAVLHDLAMAARYADRIAIMKSGALLAIGPPQDTLTEACIAEAFGVQTRITHSDVSRLMIEPLYPLAGMTGAAIDS